MMAARTHAQELLLQLPISRQLRGRHLVRDATIDHHTDGISHVECHSQILLNQQNGNLPFRRQHPQRLSDVLDDHRCQAFGGLVHHQQTWLQKQRTANGQHLLLTARKLASPVALALR